MLKDINANLGDQNFDPRDLSGIWMLTRNDHTLGTPAPPLTPAGTAAKAGRVADRNGAHRQRPLVHLQPDGLPAADERRRADGNRDAPEPRPPVLPVGAPDALPLDGRPRAALRARISRTSARRGTGTRSRTWNGNTLVVNTVGLEERAWLDNAGNPKSFHARIEETWRRVDSNTLEMQLTLHDPEYYTAPYVGNKKLYKRVPNERMTYFGWFGLYAGVTEGICAPMNEVEGYNKGFRDPGQAGR